MTRPDLPSIGSVICHLVPSRQHEGFFYLQRCRVIDHIAEHHKLTLPSPDGERPLHGVVGETLQTFVFHPANPEGGRLLPVPRGAARSEFIETHELEPDLLIGIPGADIRPEEHHFVQAIRRGGGRA
jgi:hypothetical protein